MEWIMLVITLWDKKTNVWSWQHMKVNTIIRIIKGNKYRWDDYIIWLKDYWWTITVTNWIQRGWTKMKRLAKTRWWDALTCYLGPTWPETDSGRRSLEKDFSFKNDEFLDVIFIIICFDKWFIKTCIFIWFFSTQCWLLGASFKK